MLGDGRLCTINDYDKAEQNGAFTSETASHAPVVGVVMTGLQLRGLNGRVQLAFRHANGELYYRTEYQNAFSHWYKINTTLAL